jgi:GT2 family glycosyltransferase
MKDDSTIAGKGGPPSVLVVSLNWNGWQDTLTSVESVLQLNYPNLRVLVIDNGSADGSAAHLRTIQDDRVELLELPENLGYTGGCNEGFKRAMADGFDYVWLLNSDAVVDDKDTLGSLVALAESDPKIGLVTPRIAALGDEDRLTFSGGICVMDPPGWDHTADPEQARRWAQQYPNAGLVLGTALLVRTSMIRKIGMFDDRFFAYFEDNDLSYRSLQAGYRNLVDENSVVRHEEKDAVVDPATIKPHWWYYMTRNECRFWRKHLGVIRALKIWRWDFHKTMLQLRRCGDNRVATDAMLAGLWHGWTNRGGPYRAEYRMPKLLAAAIRRYATATGGLEPSEIRND